MSKLRMRGFFKTKSRLHRSTTDLAEWTKNDEKLMKAVEKEDAKKVASLLSKKSLIPTKLGYQGSSVFHIACAVGNVQIVDLLLKEISNVNDLTIQGNTALQLAAAKGHPVVVRKLLQAVADVNLGDNHEMTALHHACAGLHLECVRVLLDGNASPHLAEKGGKTPLFYAAHRGDVNICRSLIDKGANVNCKDSVSVTPLMIAAKEGHRKICELLLKRGADSTVTDREGNAALIYALASGHVDLQEVFAKAPERFLPDSNSITPSDSGSQPSESGSKKQEEIVNADTVQPIEILPTNAAIQSDDEVASQADAHSVHSMDDALMSRAHHSPKPSPQQSKTEKAYLELKSEHDQLNEDYSSLSIENLRLRDKLESLQSKMNDKHQQEISSEVQAEIRTLKTMLDEEKEKNRRAEEALSNLESGSEQVSGSSKQTESSSGASSTSAGLVSEEEESLSDKQKSDSHMNENQSTAVLQNEILALRRQNELLKASMKLPNGVPVGADTNSSGEKCQEDLMKSLHFENSELKEQLHEIKAECDKERLRGAVDVEKVLQENHTMTEEIVFLKKQVEALEAAKNAPQTDSQRLDALVAGSQMFEEVVDFDEEGFVQGRDMTKEEFLQAQNQQLKTHCGLVTKELEKLRSQFYAILEAGDQLQADYDQLAVDKDTLHDEMEVALKAKAELVQENEFLLTDNNALHEDLKKLVHELEKMQDRDQTAQAEIEELKRSVTVASKVGEVSRLLEERDSLQQKCAELAQTAERLQTDHGLLLEEVESLNEMVSRLTSEKNQMSAEVEEMAGICQQHESLQQDYTQLEHDFGELVREKEALEMSIAQDPTVNRVAIDALQNYDASGNTYLSSDNHVSQSVSSLHQQNSQVPVASQVGNTELGDVFSSGSGDGHDSRPIRQYQDEIASLKKQISRLNNDIEFHMMMENLTKEDIAILITWEKRHEDTVHTYRTHLLSAVQGHMDPDVKDALYHIIELRSMEQFC